MHHLTDTPMLTWHSDTHAEITNVNKWFWGDDWTSKQQWLCQHGVQTSRCHVYFPDQQTQLLFVLTWNVQ